MAMTLNFLYNFLANISSSEQYGEIPKIKWYPKKAFI